MRVIFMLLLLANLGLLAWTWWHAGNEDLPRGRPAAVAQRLLLLDETPSTGAGEEQLARNATEEEIPAVIEPVPARQCFSVGPFESVEQAELATRRLAELGIRAGMREAGGQIRAGFWVYLPPFGSRSAAMQAADELRGRGVQDLFVVTDPAQRNAISLGLFSTPDRADQRAAQIGRLGYSPRVAERFRDATVYWLDFAEPAGASLEPEALGVTASGDTVPEKREISCDSIAVARPRA